MGIGHTGVDARSTLRSVGKKPLLIKASANPASTELEQSNTCKWLDLSGEVQEIVMNGEVAHRLLRLILRRYPLLSGMGTLVQHAPLKWVRFNEQQLLVRLANGYEILLFPNDFIGKNVYLFGDLDPKVTKILCSVLSPGDTFVDVGANVGIMVLQCLPFIGVSGRVVAVEPQRVCCEALSETLKVNRIHNVEIHEVALSDRSGTLDLCIPDESNLGTASLSRKSRGPSQPIAVEVMTAHEFLEARRIRCEYVVKIDVEGHESNVVRGCLPYFRKHPPKAIIFESTAHKYEGQKFSDNEPYRILVAEKYRVFAIKKSLFRLKITEVFDGERRLTATDFVAVAPYLVDRLLGFQTCNYGGLN